MGKMNRGQILLEPTPLKKWPALMHSIVSSCRKWILEMWTMVVWCSPFYTNMVRCWCFQEVVEYL